MTDGSREAFRDGLMRLLPNLRAFAHSICRNRDMADDLVQETILKAWQAQASFAPGSNLKAWLFAILRNTYLSLIRRRRFEIEDSEGNLAETLGVAGDQAAHMDLMDFAAALETLPREQREAIVLIGAEGFSYEDAALMCGCAVGTIKSRVSRARTRLAELMDEDIEPTVEAASYGSRQRPDVAS